MRHDAHLGRPNPGGEEEGGFTDEDCRLAMDWNRCAVGERADWRIDCLGPPGSERDVEGDAITVLGMKFWMAVNDDRAGEADRLLKSIHRVMRGEDP